MAEDGRVPAASELIYVPTPSWLPGFTAFGTALVLVGLFAGWVFSAFGAVILVPALVRWFTQANAEIERMPLEQRPVTAVLPPQTQD